MLASGRSARADDLSDFNAAVESASAHNRVAIGYLRTGNVDLASLEIERLRDAWGKLTGEPGVLFVTRGPGATNGAVGVHTAFQDSTPLVLFIGQVASDQRDREAFQEVDYRAMLGPSIQ